MAEQEQSEQQTPVLKLEELIRQGGQKYPPLKGDFFFEDHDDDGKKFTSACALGSALLIWKPQTRMDAINTVEHLYPLFRATGLNPLARVGDLLPEGIPTHSDFGDQLAYVIIYLFDKCNYTHDDLAAWIKGLPQDRIALTEESLEQLKFFDV